MKKKLFLLHGFVLLISLLILLISSIFIIEDLNKKNCETTLKEALDMTRNVLNETSSTDSELNISSASTSITSSFKNIRLTIIDPSGNVVYDSLKDTIEENHLNREEINNLGSIVIRYSQTLDTNMMYLAGMYTSSENTLYIRVSMPMSAVNSAVKQNITVAVIMFILVLLINLLIDFKFIESSFKPLKREINRLNYIVTGNYLTPSEIEIDSLSSEIDKTKDLIESKINSLNTEKEKLNYILNSMQQGLIIVDQDMNIILVNDYIKRLFSYTQKDNDSLLNITIMPRFSSLFKEALVKNEVEDEIEINSRNYLLQAKTFSTSSLNNGNTFVCLSLFDITNEINLKNTKKDFFANASHELKSPLTSIIGYSEMIKNGFVETKEDIDSSLDRILFEAKRMNEIVIEMLELSRLETKDVKEEKTYISLSDTINKVLNTFNQYIIDKNIEVIKNNDDLKILITSEDIYCMVKNIIENAIKYNKDNGKIFINISSENKTLEIEDTGIGIPIEYKDRIFERFFRVDKARSKSLGGTGLGLSIVKHICINNKIKIELDSKEGEFSNFKFIFK